MKQKLPALAVLSLIVLLAWTACTKPTPFGANLLEGEMDDHIFTDTITVNFTVEREDSTITADRTSTAPFFLCGELDDPFFGKSRADIYTLFQLSTFDPGFDENRHDLDSIVLYLRYNIGGVYGDTTLPQTLRVFRLDQELDADKNYYSIESIPATTEIGSATFMPRPSTVDSLFVASTKAPYLSVRLSDDFGNEMLGMDSVDLISDSAFYRVARGLKITTSAGAGLPGAILGFDLNDQGYSRLRLYYTQDDTLAKTFDYYFGGTNKFASFTHNYSGSMAGQQIGQVSEDLLYVQGMNGLRLKMEIPYISQLDNIVVNEADLVLTAASLPGDFATLKPASQLVFTVRGDSTLIFTPDVTFSLGPTLSGGFSAFGGFPVAEEIGTETVQRYRLALSDHLQQIVDDTSGLPEKRTVYISVYPQNRSAMRSILYGPKNATFPAKLALKYTRL